MMLTATTKKKKVMTKMTTVTVMKTRKTDTEGGFLYHYSMPFTFLFKVDNASFLTQTWITQLITQRLCNFTRVRLEKG